METNQHINAKAAEAFSSEVLLEPHRESPPHQVPQTPKFAQTNVATRQAARNLNMRGGISAYFGSSGFAVFSTGSLGLLSALLVSEPVPSMVIDLVGGGGGSGEG